ncbi:reverse transcriptase domain-containing protein, partial [Phocaeicola vulgatus]
RQRLMMQIKEIVKERLKYPASDEMDSDMKRLKYVRYADDFLIGIIGSKEDCIHIKEDIKKFMAEKLKLELSDEKTLITNARKHAKFLGYDIFVRKSN